ncbi:MAG: hypothetical protein LBC69_00165 [Eubacteriaceae bacterium]|nr:hypothetical protein [Eubacteriaceae bacterium]
MARRSQEAGGGAPRKGRLKFVRDIEKRMRKSREANLPAGPDGFVGAAASGKYGPGETVATRSMYSYISQGLPAAKPADLPRKGRARRPAQNRRALGESIREMPG